MAGVYTGPRAAAAVAWHQPAINPLFGRGGTSMPLPGGNGFVQAVGAPMGHELAGLGATAGGHPLLPDNEVSSWLMAGAALTAAFVPAEWTTTRRIAQVGLVLTLGYRLLEGRLQ